MSSSAAPALFRSIRVGDMNLSHRVALAPCTRLRSDSTHVPSDLYVEYYKQRASIPGTLLISEGTFIAPQAGIIPHAPGIWSDAQIAAWKKVTDAVHAQGSFIYLQIAGLGRSARPALLKLLDPSFEVVAPSPIPLSDRPEDVPKEMTKDDIKQYVQWFAIAAANAVHKAGFDGVEVHGANGFLVDQFIQDMSNKRTDEYGGSIENRVRFPLEVINAISAAIGASKTALRLSPWSNFQDMHMKDPVPTFSHLVEEIKRRQPNLAYLHVVTPNIELATPPTDKSEEQFIHKLWAPRPIISAGGYNRESALKAAEEPSQIIAFGASFIANPDLPFRLQKNISLNAPDASTFYTQEVEGYTTYPFSEEFLKTRST